MIMEQPNFNRHACAMSEKVDMTYKKYFKILIILIHKDIH